MKCTNCAVDIPEQWAKVIASNICPNCEGPILNDFAMDLMVELKEALEQMPNNPTGLASWLVANYKMQKIGNAKPVSEFYDGKKQKQEITEQNLKIANNPLQAFIKRTGMDPNKIEQYKALAQEINAEASDEPTISVSDNDVPEAEDPVETVKIIRAMEGGQSLKKNKHVSPVIDDGTDELPEVLQLDRLKRLQKQQDVANGVVTGFGKGTSFRRSE